MAGKVKAIPEGTNTVTPHLVIRGAAKAIEYYKNAFGAQELMRMQGPGGMIGHAELKIGNSVIFLADEFPQAPCKAPQSLGATTCTLNLYVEDVDNVYDTAVRAGGKAAMPPADMFWGDRYGQLVDPFGHVWGVATHKEDVNPEEMEKRAKAFWASMAQAKTA
jgi:PhnB protein